MLQTAGGHGISYFTATFSYLDVNLHTFLVKMKLYKTCRRTHSFFSPFMIIHYFIFFSLHPPVDTHSSHLPHNRVTVDVQRERRGIKEVVGLQRSHLNSHIGLHVTLVMAFVTHKKTKFIPVGKEKTL